MLWCLDRSLRVLRSSFPLAVLGISAMNSTPPRSFLCTSQRSVKSNIIHYLHFLFFHPHITVADWQIDVAYLRIALFDHVIVVCPIFSFYCEVVMPFHMAIPLLTYNWMGYLHQRKFTMYRPIFCYFYCSLTKYGEGNVFTGVSLFTGWVCLLPTSITGHMTKGVCHQGSASWGDYQPSWRVWFLYIFRQTPLLRDTDIKLLECILVDTTNGGYHRCNFVSNLTMFEVT